MASNPIAFPQNCICSNSGWICRDKHSKIGDMDDYSKYWILHQINTLGRYQGKKNQEAEEFFHQQFAGVEKDKEIVQQLWRLYQGEDSLLAELCLRCLISQQMKTVCLQIAAQYGKKHDFTGEELMFEVLEHQSFPRGRKRETGDNREDIFLTRRILQTFNPEKSGLFAWTKKRVKTAKEVRRFLLEHGIEQISDWCLLKETSERRLLHILNDYHRSSKLEIQQFQALITSYQTVYLAQVQANRDKINQRRKKEGRGHTTAPYPGPTNKQLQTIAQQLLPRQLSPEDVLEELKKLALLIREFKRHRVRSIATQTLGKTESIFPSPVEEEDESNFLLDHFREKYHACFTKAVQEVIEARVNYYRNKKKSKDSAFLQALHLYHCQTVSMGKIAPQIGLKGQPQVSRLLEEKEIRADVARKTVTYLLPILMQVLPEKLAPAEEQQRRQTLTPLLLEKVNQEIAKAKKEASVSKNRTMNSTLSRTICQYLDKREQG